MSYTAEYNTFWYWMNERHKIHQKKMTGDAFPWTDDPILQAWRFCQVFREMDKTTTWIRINWREPYADHPNLWLAMALARFTNHIPTLEAVGFPDVFDPDKITERMQSKARRGEKVFTSAYMITGKLASDSGTDKCEMVARQILLPLYERMDPSKLQGMSLQQAFNYFGEFPGFGGTGFMSYEVVSDLRHTRYLKDAPDTMTWANAGPGAQRGLNRLFGRALNRTVPQAVALKEMAELLEMANSVMSPLGPHLPRPLEMRDIEHSLCEMDKYIRVRDNQGFPRERYHAPKVPRASGTSTTAAPAPVQKTPASGKTIAQLQAEEAAGVEGPAQSSLF